MNELPKQSSPENSLITPDWDRYYSEPTTSFRESDSFYKEALIRLSELNPDLLNPDSPKTFILGGFHPYNGTPMEFMYFCRTIHPNPEDQHVFVDKNLQAVEAAPKGPTIRAVLSSVEDLSLDPSSADFIIMDFTTYFMSDEQISAFAKRASEILTDNGVTLIAKGINYHERQLVERGFIPRYPRSLERLIDLMSPLKPVDFTNGRNSSRISTYVSFAKKNSLYPQAVPSEQIIREGEPAW